MTVQTLSIAGAGPKDLIIAAYEEIEAEALEVGMNLDRPGVHDELWCRAEIRVGDMLADAVDRARDLSREQFFS